VGALDLKPFAEVGTCHSSRIALSLVEDPYCTGGSLPGSPIVDVGGLERMSRSVRVSAFIRSNATLRRVAGVPVRRLLGARKPAPRVSMPSRTSTERLVFLYGARNAHDDHYSSCARKSIESGRGTLCGGAIPVRAAHDRRRSLKGFDGLPPRSRRRSSASSVPP
jgi:hypothetical protein